MLRIADSVYRVTSLSVKYQEWKLMVGQRVLEIRHPKNYTEKCGRKSKRVIRGDMRPERETCKRETIKIFFQNNVKRMR